MSAQGARKGEEAPCELAVIVPTYNEAAALPALIECLAAQLDVSFELVVSDGGSTDTTVEVARAVAERHGLRINVLSGGKGRGEQLNRGATASGSEHLLFLHADSRFAEPLALRKGLDLLACVRLERHSDAVGGHYALSFDRNTTAASPPYYFYECKARLDRVECTHGDQGLLLPRSYFERIGPFVTFPPMLAETRLADRIRETGALRLIRSGIITSARRFETEGLYQRQVLNAILMTSASQGWDKPFQELAGLYRAQSDSGRLQLAPLLDAVRQLIARMPPAQLRQFWRQTGEYVRRNAWQLAFLVDVRRGFRDGLAPGDLQPRMLDRFDRHWDRFTDHAMGRFAAAGLTRLWFALTRIHARHFGA